MNSMQLLKRTMLLLLSTLTPTDVYSSSQAPNNVNLNEIFKNDRNLQESGGNFTQNSPGSRGTNTVQTVWGTVKVNSSLRIRTEPWGTIIGKLYNGNRVRVDLAQSKPNWYKIFRDDRSGFSHKNYIVLDSEQDHPVVAPVPVSNTVTEPLPAPEASRPAPIPSGPLSDRVDTSDGAYILGVPSFKQKANDPFSPDGSSWRPQGYCGPTSLQMVLAYYGIEKARDDLALTACSSDGRVLDTNVRSTGFRGHLYAKGSGASWDGFLRQGQRFGFDKSKITQVSTSSTMRDRIAKGRPQIVSVRGTLNFKNGNSYTTAGHIMVVRGVRANGDLVINDPVRGGDMIMSERNFFRVSRGISIDIKR